MNRQYLTSPVGLWEITAGETGLRSIRPVFTSKPDLPNVWTEKAVQCLKAYFAGAPVLFDLPLALEGSPFCRLVWEALAKIPYGQVITYGELAATIGRPTACRAVANAVGKNPLLILLPCHRVVASNGIGGFSAGLPLKRFLLELEGVKITENTPIF